MMHILHRLQSRGQDEGDGGNQRHVGENFDICKNCLNTLNVQYSYMKDDQSYQGDKKGIFTR